MVKITFSHFETSIKHVFNPYDMQLSFTSVKFTIKFILSD